MVKRSQEGEHCFHRYENFFRNSQVLKKIRHELTTLR